MHHRATIILTLFLLALDLGAKSAAHRYLAAPVEIVPGVLKLFASENPHAAFSLPIPSAILLFLTPLLLAAGVWFIFRGCNMKRPLSRLILAFFLAGGLGNFLNRFLSGAVTDFIAFSFWPSFNLADMYLTTAAFLLVAFYGKINI